MVGGQVLDITADHHKPSLELLKGIHARKTGALIAAACRMGAIVQSAIELGLQEKQLSHLKEVYQQRKNALNTSLRKNLPDSVSFIEPDGGFFTWLQLPQHVDTEKLIPEAHKHDVSFAPGSFFSPRRNLKNYMRLSFAYYEEPELKEGAKRLAAAIKRQLS